MVPNGRRPYRTENGRARHRPVCELFLRCAPGKPSLGVAPALGRHPSAEGFFVHLASSNPNEPRTVERPRTDYRRHGALRVRDAFQAAVDRGDREESMRILCDVGADEQTAWEMIAVLIRTEGGEPPIG